MHGLIFETSVCYWQNQPGYYRQTHTRQHRYEIWVFRLSTHMASFASKRSELLHIRLWLACAAHSLLFQVPVYRSIWLWFPRLTDKQSFFLFDRLFRGSQVMKSPSDWLLSRSIYFSRKSKHIRSSDSPWQPLCTLLGACTYDYRLKSSKIEVIIFASELTLRCTTSLSLSCYKTWSAATE